MERAKARYAQADSLQQQLHASGSAGLGGFSITEPSGWIKVAALRIVAYELECVALALKQRDARERGEG